MPVIFQNIRTRILALAEAILASLSQMGILRRLAAQRWSNQAAAVQVAAGRAGGGEVKT